MLVDLQMGFDVVAHNNLVTKLDHYGIRSKENQWSDSSDSFLRECKETVFLKRAIYRVCSSHKTASDCPSQPLTHRNQMLYL